jgi:hypothetical protein
MEVFITVKNTSYLHVFLLEVEFGCVLAAATAAKLPTT